MDTTNSYGYKQWLEQCSRYSSRPAFLQKRGPKHNNQKNTKQTERNKKKVRSIRPPIFYVCIVDGGGDPPSCPVPFASGRCATARAVPRRIQQRKFGHSTTSIAAVTR